MRHALGLIFLVLLCSLSARTAAQGVEIGLLGGVSMYSGDLSPAEFGIFTQDFNPAGGLFLRYSPGHRLAFRLAGVFTQVSATDDKEVFLDAQGRSRSFRSSISEVGLTASLNLFYLGDPNDRYLAPYLLGGVSLVSFNPEGNLDGIWYELQPLRTEGQGIPGGNYAPTPYSLQEISLHLGGGLRWQAGDRVSLGFEIGGRRIASDYLDDISDVSVNYLDILENTGPTAAYFSNPSIQDPSAADADRTYARGGEFADWFFTGTFTVGLRLGSGGGGGRGKMGCYSF